MGFPGGVAWAMMVARVCQLFPYATTAIVISKFYKIFAAWKWPDPVLLCEIEGHALGLKVWNPRVCFLY
jgi:poly(A) polymerase